MGYGWWVERGVGSTVSVNLHLYYNYALILANDILQSPPNVSCACPGEVLTFICIINEAGITLWTGSAFSCNSNDIILLHHSQFSEPGGTSGSCNNGSISGRSIGVTNGCYSSELDVTVSPDFNGRTILCNHDGITQRTIGASTLNVVTGKFSVLVCILATLVATRNRPYVV